MNPLASLWAVGIDSGRFQGKRPPRPDWQKPDTALSMIRGSGVAGSTRLELATSGVTGRRSNQLNYDPAKWAPSLYGFAMGISIGRRGT